MSCTDHKIELVQATPRYIDSKHRHSTVQNMATIENDDERLLARIGYVQDMKRHFSGWSTISYAISVLGILGSVPATFHIPLCLGGPAAVVWAWLIGSIMAYCIAASVSELVSAYPTAGGMYFVTKYVVPSKHVAIWSWIIGWCNLLGQTAGVASVSYTLSQMILAAASINSSFNGETYSFSPTSHMTVGGSLVMLAICGVVCSLSTKKLHQIVFWFAPINICATLIICIVLYVNTPSKATASWVFTTFNNGSGWGIGFSFLLSFLSVAWVMTDYDGTTHMSEETIDAAARGPQAIRIAIVSSGLLGWVLSVTLCFCITDLDILLKTPTGLPAAQIFLNAAGVRGGTAMWFWVILVQFFTGCTAMLADTRMAYAFARDGALPFSEFFSKINSKTKTPVHAVWFIVFFSMCLNLVGFGSILTISAIFAITAPALDLSYVAVIVARNIYSKSMPFQEGPYTLGRWQKPVNAIACIWVFFISVILMFPTMIPITVANMNYAVAVAAGIAFFALAWWYAGARKRYFGPKTQNRLLLSQSDEEQRLHG